MSEQNNQDARDGRQEIESAYQRDFEKVCRAVKFNAETFPELADMSPVGAIGWLVVELAARHEKFADRQGVALSDKGKNHVERVRPEMDAMGGRPSVDSGSGRTNNVRSDGSDMASDLVDDFRGDDAHLVSCIKALISMNDAGALVPHGIGGHARSLLSAAAVRLSRASSSRAEVERNGDRLRHLIENIAFVDRMDLGHRSIYRLHYTVDSSSQCDWYDTPEAAIDAQLAAAEAPNGEGK